MENLVLILVMFVALYFVMIRPQQKRMKETQDMLSKLQKGSRVVTIGGLHGVVEEVDEKTVVLDCEGIYLTFERRAIATVTHVSSEELKPAAQENQDIVQEEIVEENASNE